MVDSLLQLFVYTSLVHVMYVLSLFVTHLCFFWCLGKAVIRDWSIS